MSTLSGFHERTIFSIDWSPHGDFIATGAADDAIRVFRQHSPGTTFNLAAVERKAHSSDINCVRWNPAAVPTDGSGSLLLASAGDDAVIRIWRFTPPQH